MKVGDMVKQNYNLVQFNGNSPLNSGKGPFLPQTEEMIGLVLEIVDRADPAKNNNIPEKFLKWRAMLGRSVTVLWTNGRISTSVAENALELIDEEG